MIRIKCPKCATVLKLDDDQAGQVGQCTECAAKFRVPAKKAAVPTTSDKVREEKRRPPASKRRDDDDDDDEEDDDDDEEGGDEPAPARKKHSGLSQSAKMNIQMGGVFIVLGVLICVGGIFVDQMALIACAACAFIALCIGLMVAREAWQESPLKFVITLLIPLGSWERYKQFCITWTALVVLALGCYGANYLHDERVAQKRVKTLEKLKAYRPELVNKQGANLHLKQPATTPAV